MSHLAFIYFQKFFVVVEFFYGKRLFFCIVSFYDETLVKKLENIKYFKMKRKVIKLLLKSSFLLERINVPDRC